MPERLNLPRVATLGLALVIGLQLAWIVTGALGSHDLVAESAARPGTPAPVGPGSAVQDVADRIAAARLFGDAGPAESRADAAQAPPTSLALVLAGVFAREDPGAGRAIIGESAASARLHAVGATLPGGARLVEVYPDRVILERGGQREALSLPRSTLPPAAAGTPVSPAAAPSTAANSALATFAEDPARYIRWQAMLRDGQVAGVRVYPGEMPTLFARSGLRAGDLVVAVNDSPLSDQATAAQFLRMLAGAPNSVVTVERDGRTENLQVDLASLNPVGTK
jgi:general secretion pathway protein C